MISLKQLAEQLNREEIQCLKCGKVPKGKQLQKYDIQVGTYQRYYFVCNFCKSNNTINFKSKTNTAQYLGLDNGEQEFYYSNNKTTFVDYTVAIEPQTINGFIIYNTFFKLINFQ